MVAFFIDKEKIMILTLYSIDDSDNTINKTLADGYDLDIRLRGDVDINNLEIRLREVAGIDYASFNYATIGDLGRFYFIDRLGLVSRTDSILYLKCDYLESFKDDILASNARVKRNIKTGDFFNASLDSNVNKTVTVYDGDYTMVDGVHTLIVSVVGG